MATVRQKLALKKIAENHGNVSRGMLAAGYSPVTAKTPGNLTKSKGFQELLDEFLPEALLVEIHKEGLKATKMSNSLTSPDEELPDFPTRHKYLETAYKVRGKLKENDQSNKTLVLVVSGETAQRYGLPTNSNTENGRP